MTWRNEFLIPEPWALGRTPNRPADWELVHPGLDRTTVANSSLIEGYGSTCGGLGRPGTLPDRTAASHKEVACLSPDLLIQMWVRGFLPTDTEGRPVARA